MKGTVSLCVLMDPGGPAHPVRPQRSPLPGCVPSAGLDVSQQPWKMATMSLAGLFKINEQSLVALRASQCICLCCQDLSVYGGRKAGWVLDTSCPLHYSDGPQDKTHCEGRSFFLLLPSLVL